MAKMKKKKNKILPGLWAAFVLLCLFPDSVRGAESGWVRREDGWYYYDENGNPGRGWINGDGKSYYVLEDGKLFAGGITPDGYYVDTDGVWYQRTKKLMGKDFSAPPKALSPASAWYGKEALTGLKTVINQGFSGTRSLKITENAVEYVLLEPVEENAGSGTASGSSSVGSSTGKSLTGDSGVINRDNIDAILSGRNQTAQVSAQKMKETVLLGLYREPAQGRYRLDICIGLDGDESSVWKSSAYDYEMFQAMIFQVSSVPEILTDGIYSAWEEDNRWGISRQSWVQVGDCLVLYTSGNGFGRFYISPAQRGH